MGSPIEWIFWIGLGLGSQIEWIKEIFWIGLGLGSRILRVKTDFLDRDGIRDLLNNIGLAYGFYRLNRFFGLKWDHGYWWIKLY